MTLSMDWARGDAHYGPDFIQLNSPCQRQVEKPCVCVADFKVVSSSANPAEFANYVTSFEHGKVPVTFEVRYSAEGLFLEARLLCVGNWTRDRFHPNDGLLGVQPWRMFSSKQALTLLNHFAAWSKLLSLRQSVRSRTRRNFSDLKTNQALPSSRDCKNSQIPLGETVGFRVLPLLRLRRSFLL